MAPSRSAALPPRSAAPFGRSPGRLLAAVLAAAVLAAVPLPAAAQDAAAGGVPVERVDSLFARFAGDATPGCAVGVSREGRMVLARAYGMADLEHGVPNTPETVFEAGSVSKQFTAAAVVLLAQEGKLSLDDDVRTYIPELPDYGEPITIRHLIHHTSGLRDWGSVAAIGGWPRGTRVHTHEHVLDIASRQRSLNYPPGELYSYTNTGYNLMAILVERVSGMPFAEFTRRRLFEPLGLASTEWRDDYTRIVEGRAVAYRRGPGDSIRMQMPFENVHGNGGLLTTVEDLLRWTENLETGEVGGPAFVEEMHRRGRLDSGREIAYASGLQHGDFRGVRQVSHGGATAGYRAYLTRFPDRRLGVAVLCNLANVNPAALAYQVAGLYLDASPGGGGEKAAGAEGARADAPVAVELPPEALAARAGLYRETRRHGALRLAVEGGSLRVPGGPVLVALSATRFLHPPSGRAAVFEEPPEAGRRSAFLLIDADDDTVRYEPVDEFAPGPEELAAFAGSYHSDEAEATYTVEARDGALFLRRRYGKPVRLEPVYEDAFRGAEDEFGIVRFIRDDAGRVVELGVGSGRVWDMRFRRTP